MKEEGAGSDDIEKKRQNLNFTLLTTLVSKPHWYVLAVYNASTINLDQLVTRQATIKLWLLSAPRY